MTHDASRTISDVVLRDVAKKADDYAREVGAGEVGYFLADTRDLLREVADEIKRLRAALKEIASDDIPHQGGCCGVANARKRVALAALAPPEAPQEPR